MSRRENDFPATSIGRTSGSRFTTNSNTHTAPHSAPSPAPAPAHTPAPTPAHAHAHESSHPLLSPRDRVPEFGSFSSATGQGHGAAAAAALNSGQPARYVPYTPRQRGTPTPSTATATTSVSSGSQSTGQTASQSSSDAARALQIVNLKSAAQSLGLDSSSLGWTFLEKLVNITGSEEILTEEWAEVWNAICSSKATLLLPRESATSQDRSILPDLVKDHVVLLDGPPSRETPIQIVTLSGIRGVLIGNLVILRSSTNPQTRLFADVVNPETRQVAMGWLPPLSSPSDSQGTCFPRYEIGEYSASLPLPSPVPPPSLARSQTQPQASASGTKPPLPPRPGSRVTSPSPLDIGTPGTPATAGRIGNPFASLFGGRASPAPPAPTPLPPIESPTTLTSNGHADSGSPVTAGPAAPPIEISALTIDRRIVWRDVAKEVNEGVKAELKAAIGAAVPAWIADRVYELTGPWYPFVKPPPTPSSSSSAKRGIGSLSKAKGLNTVLAGKELGRIGKELGKELNGIPSWIPNTFALHSDDSAAHWQDFVMLLEQDMRLVQPSPRSQKEEGGNGYEEKIKETLEVVERGVMGVFYDRFFMQPTTDDLSHDAALSNRIAALNLLDLGLSHLGIDIGKVDEEELDGVVRACGDMLTQLHTCRSPADKATVLVAAHKIVVDGLSRLPPIRLTPDDEVKDNPPHVAAVESEVVDEKEKEREEKGEQKKEPEEKDAEKITAPSLSASLSTASETTVVAPTPDPSATTEKDISSTEPQTSPAVATTEAIPQSTLELPPAKEPTPVSGDVLLPLIIYSVVKSNPPHLVSNLLFTQRFRSHSLSGGGEEGYCLINLMAVAEFLENVDMAALGLGDVEKVLSTADLTPIPITRSPVTPTTPLGPAIDTTGPLLTAGPGLGGSIRGRVGQGVDVIADSANKVISGVVDSSFGILRSFMPGPGSSNAANNALSPTAPSISGRTTPGSAGKQGFGLLRRGPEGSTAGSAGGGSGGFSIASIAAALPIAGRRSNPDDVAGQREMVVVGSSLASSRPGSRAGSVRSMKAGSIRSVKAGSVRSGKAGSVRSASLKIRVGAEGEDESLDDSDDDGVDGETESSGSEEDEDDDGGENHADPGDPAGSGGVQRSERLKGGVRPRKTLSDRLATVSALAAQRGPSPTGSRRSSLLLPNQSTRQTSSPSSSRPTSPVQQHHAIPPQQPLLKLAPPKQRFVECTPDDLRLAEVGELLRDYRRLVEGIRAVGGFDE